MKASEYILELQNETRKTVEELEVLVSRYGDLDIYPDFFIARNTPMLVDVGDKRMISV